jgi:hypothetical protein
MTIAEAVKAVTLVRIWKYENGRLSAIKLQQDIERDATDVVTMPRLSNLNVFPSSLFRSDAECSKYKNKLN